MLHKIPYPEVGKPSLKHTLEVCDSANIHLSINLNGDLSITGDLLLAALDEEDVSIIQDSEKYSALATIGRNTVESR